MTCSHYYAIAEGHESAFSVDISTIVYSFSAQDPTKREVALAPAEADSAWGSTQVLSELA